MGCAMLLMLISALMGFQSVDHTREIEFLRLSYKANKDAFAFGTFRFEYTRGSCASLSEAEAGVFSRSIKEEGFYAFDGRNARFELIARPGDLASMTTRINERTSSAIAMSLRMLTDGEVTLLDRLQPDASGIAFDHDALIHKGRLFYQDGFFQFPLWIGDKNARGYDLYTDLTRLKDRKVTLDELDFDALLGGQKVCKVSLAWKSGKRTYWIDSKRGSVPLRIVDHYAPTHLDVTFIFSDLEQVQGAGWLPRKVIHIVGPGRIVDHTVVTKIDTRDKPPASLFQLDFPKAVGMVDRAKQLVYPKSKSWSLMNLPSRSSAGTRPAIPRTYIAPADLPGEVEAGAPWEMIVLGSVAIGLVVGSILIVRRRGKTPHAA